MGQAFNDYLLENPQEAKSVVGKMIEAAIAHGAPLYNAGHASQCAKVYMDIEYRRKWDTYVVG